MGGLSGPPGPARLGAGCERSQGRSGRAALRAVVVPALVAVVNGVAFVAVDTAAFHHPTPHSLPLGMVGTEQQVQQARAFLDRGATHVEDDGVRRAWLLLSLWTVVPLLLVAVVDVVARRRAGRRYRPRALPGTPRG
jgi:hypothetical protein